MNVQRIKVGAKLEVGDRICSDSWCQKSWHKVVRVTEKFAIVQINSTYQQKFPRIVPLIGLHPSGKRDIWSTTEHSAWRPVEEAPVVTETPSQAPSEA